MKEIVKLRQKVGKTTGVASLFLEWNEDGKRKFEFLNMYLYPEKDAETKRMNKLTLEAAKTIQAQRIVQIQTDKAGIVRKSKVTLREQLDTYLSTHRQLSDNYVKALKHARSCWDDIVGDMTLTSIGRKEMLKFSAGLQDRLASSSASHTYNITSTILQSAVRSGVISSNPAKLLDQSERPKDKSPEREFLTLEEVRLLDATPCPSETLKKAFLFSCFTGLRLSDIVTMKWSMVTDDMVQKRMIKTDELIYQPLSANARRYLPERGSAKEYVFKLKKDSQNQRDLRAWIKTAGINKNITFHCARHTFACLLIEYDSDIYTVSKLMGHKDVSTTQIYAKMMDKKKEAAVNKIPGIE